MQSRFPKGGLSVSSRIRSATDISAWWRETNRYIAEVADWAGMTGMAA